MSRDPLNCRYCGTLHGPQDLAACRNVLSATLDATRHQLQAQVARLERERDEAHQDAEILRRNCDEWKHIARTYGKNVLTMYQIGTEKVAEAEARTDALAWRVAGLKGAGEALMASQNPHDMEHPEWQAFRDALADRPGGEGGQKWGVEAMHRALQWERDELGYSLPDDFSLEAIARDLVARFQSPDQASDGEEVRGG